MSNAENKKTGKCEDFAFHRWLGADRPHKGDVAAQPRQSTAYIATLEII